MSRRTASDLADSGDNSTTIALAPSSALPASRDQLSPTAVSANGSKTRKPAFDNSAPYQPQLEAPVRGFVGAYLKQVGDVQAVAVA